MKIFICGNSDLIFREYLTGEQMGEWCEMLPLFVVKHFQAAVEGFAAFDVDSNPKNWCDGKHVHNGNNSINRLVSVYDVANLAEMEAFRTRLILAERAIQASLHDMALEGVEDYRAIIENPSDETDTQGAVEWVDELTEIARVAKEQAGDAFDPGFYAESWLVTDGDTWGCPGEWQLRRYSAKAMELIANEAKPDNYATTERPLDLEHVPALAAAVGELLAQALEQLIEDGEDKEGPWADVIAAYNNVTGDCINVGK